MEDSDFKQDDVAVALTKGLTVMLPQKRGKIWTRSRFALVKVGEMLEPVPILWLLAREAYPDWDTRTHEAVWKDKDWTNESVENVLLVEKGLGERKKTAYEFPAGSPEYWKAYREKNREKYRDYQKAYGKRRREQFNALKKAYAEQTDTVAAKAQAGLDDILSIVQAANQPKPTEESSPNPVSNPLENDLGK